jgi:hypothetical protein
MNLAQVVHERWAADSTLNGLLAAARVYTGMSFDPQRPFAVILKKSDKPESYHSDGSAIDVVRLRVQVFHDNYDDGRAIAERAKKVFDRASFDLAGSDKVLSIARYNDSETQNDDGVWQFTVDFDCRVYVAANAE